MAQESAKSFIQFVDDSRSQFHATLESVRKLKENGFSEVKEDTPWKLLPGGKYFYTRNQSMVMAFVIGGAFQPGDPFFVVGAHTDSPTMLVKPHSEIDGSLFSQVGVEMYGGGLWHTWFDRDLALAGRVILRDEKGLVSKLIRIDRPLLRIPNLAIHLAPTKEKGCMKPNPQDHVKPILCSAVKKELEGIDKVKKKKEGHSPVLLGLICKSLGCKAEDIVDFQLNLCDNQGGTLGGPNEEFVFCARQDNLAMCFCGLEGIIRASADAATVLASKQCSILALFDNEEIGSTTTQGADSPILMRTFQRVMKSLGGGDDELLDVALSKSFCLSADMAHACHPNYSDRHDPNHKPELNAGPVIKVSAKQRYATSATSIALVRELAARNDIPYQVVAGRNDMGSGGTIGPIIARRAGIRVVDLGGAMLSMHSIREMMGASDISHCARIFERFFLDFAAIDGAARLEDIEF